MSTPQRSIADRLVRGVPLTLCGREWTLLVSYRVLLDTEEVTGLDMLGSVEAVVAPSAKSLQALLWAMIVRDGGDDLSLRDIGAYITVRNFEQVRKATLAAFSASMPKPEPRGKKDTDDGEAGKRPAPMSWIDTWAAARNELGLSDAEWLEMTPLQFHALRACRVRQLQREELMFSRLTANVINFSMSRPPKRVADDHFMIHRFPEGPEREITGESIMSEMHKKA